MVQLIGLAAVLAAGLGLAGYGFARAERAAERAWQEAMARWRASIEDERQGSA